MILLPSVPQLAVNKPESFLAGLTLGPEVAHVLCVSTRFSFAAADAAAPQEPLTTGELGGAYLFLPTPTSLRSILQALRMA